MITFGYAMLDEHHVHKGTLYASADLKALAQLLARMQLPEGSTAVALGPDGRVLARHPDRENLVGKLLPDNQFGA